MSRDETFSTVGQAFLHHLAIMEAILQLRIPFSTCVLLTTKIIYHNLTAVYLPSEMCDDVLWAPKDLVSPISTY